MDPLGPAPSGQQRWGQMLVSVCLSVPDLTHMLLLLRLVAQTGSSWGGHASWAVPHLHRQTRTGLPEPQPGTTVPQVFSSGTVGMETRKNTPTTI